MQRTCRGVAVDTEVESIRVIDIFLTISGTGQTQNDSKKVPKKTQKHNIYCLGQPGRTIDWYKKCAYCLMV